MFLGKFVVLQTLVLERVESVECIKTERLFFYWQLLGLLQKKLKNNIFYYATKISVKIIRTGKIEFYFLHTLEI